jgi:hypothetical protein
MKSKSNLIIAIVFLGAAAAAILYLIQDTLPFYRDTAPAGTTPVRDIPVQPIQVKLAWDGVPGASAYNLYWSTSPGVTPQNGTREISSEPFYLFTVPQMGRTYYFIVTAVTPKGESPASDAIAYTAER